MRTTAKTQNKMTIFLSHSHKDIDKVRKIRDILETLNCEPIAFFLACMDDRNTELEDLIKREIDARNIFVYCKSKHSERSKWVQKERQYIEKSGNKRIYEIDLDDAFEAGIVTLLNQIMAVIYRNTVIISRDSAVMHLTKRLETALVQRGFYVTQYDNYPEKAAQACCNGIFIPVIYKGNDTDDWRFHVGKQVLETARRQENAMYLPIVITDTPSLDYAPLQESGFLLAMENFEDSIPDIVELIARLADMRDYAQYD